MKTFYLINDTRPECHVGPELVYDMLNEGLAARDGHIVTGSYVGEDARISLEKVPAGVSAVIVNGEGTIHHTATRAPARSLCAIGRMARKRLGIPVYLINATIDDVDEESLEDLRQYSKIFARDNNTSRYLSEKGIASAVVPDLAILAQHFPAVSRNGVLISDSTKRQVREALRNLAMKQNLTYLPMQWSRVRKDGVRNWKDLIGYFNWSRQVFGKSTARRFISAFGNAQGVITGRYHGVVLCLATATPFIAVSSNTTKIEALLLDVFGNAERIATLEHLVSGQVEVPPFRLQELDKIRGFVAEAGFKSTAMFEEIADCTSASFADAR